MGLIDDWTVARSLSEVDATFEPDAARHARAAASYQRFSDLYARLRTWFV